MLRRVLISTVAVLLIAAAPAHAWSPGGVTVTRCDKGLTPDARAVVFQGRVSAVRGARKMQLRFTLQAKTPDDPVWRKVTADGFGAWITAPRGLSRYLYDKTVENLLAPASYRALVDFRWRDARGHTIRTTHAGSRACKMPDPRPDLTVAQVRVAPAAVAGRRRYVAAIANDGRGDAGTFDVDFTRNGALIGTVTVDHLLAGAERNVSVAAPACAPGDEIVATVDARSAVDESDEDDDILAVIC
jgi:CARDB